MTLKKWWVESDFKAPNLLLSIRLKVSGCHYNSIYNNTCTKQVKQLSKQYQTQWSKCQRHFYVTLYENPSFIIVTAETEYISTRSWYRNNNFLRDRISHPSPGFSRVRVTRCFVVLCRLLFVLLSFFFWSLCCVSFFNLRILITPLVSSSSSGTLEQTFENTL